MAVIMGLIAIVLGLLGAGIGYYVAEFIYWMVKQFTKGPL